MQPCNPIGYVHSLESFGSVDGPGVRFVVFLQGCALRCKYCHNPETWAAEGGEEWTVEQLFQRVWRYRNYWGKKGGITVSGGEPLRHGVGFFHADGIERSDELPVEIALHNHIRIHQMQPPDARARKRFRAVPAHAAKADHRHAASGQTRYAGFSDQQRRALLHCMTLLLLWLFVVLFFLKKRKEPKEKQTLKECCPRCVSLL